MELDKIINQVLILFFIMIIGYISGKAKVMSLELNKGLTELILNITLPAMIITSFNYSFSQEMLKKAGILFILSWLIYSALIIASKYLYSRYDNRIASVLRFITIFSNCGFMGYPVVESVYGKEGVFYTAIFNIPFNILIWVVGIMLFSSEGKSLKKALINPGIISVFIGIGIFIFSIKLPQPIYRSLEILGATTTPLSMLIIGSMLSGMNIKKLFNGIEIYYGSFIRLIAVPFLTLGVLRLIGFSGSSLGIPVLIMAMPAAANSTIMAERYGGDSALASKIVFLTTAISAVTIPIVMSLV